MDHLLYVRAMGGVREGEGGEGGKGMGGGEEGGQRSTLRLICMGLVLPQGW